MDIYVYCVSTYLQNISTYLRKISSNAQKLPLCMRNKFYIICAPVYAYTKQVDMHMDTLFGIETEFMI